MNLLWLGDPKSYDAALVGGKAAEIGRLARLYYRMPDGFSLSGMAHEEFKQGKFARAKFNQLSGERGKGSIFVHCGRTHSRDKLGETVAGNEV